MAGAAPTDANYTSGPVRCIGGLSRRRTPLVRFARFFKAIAIPHGNVRPTAFGIMRREYTAPAQIPSERSLKRLFHIRQTTSQKGGAL